MKITIINGPNLNLLGLREPGVYGDASFEDYFSSLQLKYPDVEFTYFQSNIEGVIIDKLHEVGFSADGIILNAGGYTHTSVAIGDAVKAIKSQVVEVHISNIYRREEFRHTSLTAPACVALISGLGLEGYHAAVRFLLKTAPSG